ncbi:MULTISPECIES: hypothetical protein [Methylobacterium]|jgi:hypothetical protein|uniref:Uncharacterized protein n=2 Tax=Methylobacterium TaxID=407 RepID=A0A0C6FT40_9HYPH|nr:MULTISPECIES: hypothetical protein [Methylobacterium]MBK3395175.1 hypothetical protein [Methylobacterium ajmalii]MBK3411218.1 hypothetical protein [Methylobacterium ajmalii]MBK3420528.1 hypothetical protein [Methylobacterium ajmalii]MBZ6415834.1 hypothetical protein [Methylobacterium sp.]SFF39624.1 hypothetical protein SAMN04487844_11799 [Methylobacterium sp. yr596]
MSGDLNEGPLAPAATVTPPSPKVTRRERRRQRRRRRKIGEEILGWILVPVIVLCCYWAINAGFTFFGTTPSAVFDQLKQVKTALEKRESR